MFILVLIHGCTVSPCIHIISSESYDSKHICISIWIHIYLYIAYGDIFYIYSIGCVNIYFQYIEFDRVYCTIGYVYDIYIYLNLYIYIYSIIIFNFMNTYQLSKIDQSVHLFLFFIQSQNHQNQMA